MSHKRRTMLEPDLNGFWVLLNWFSRQVGFSFTARQKEVALSQNSRIAGLLSDSV